MITYKIPDKWIKYDFETIAQNLILAKVAIETLKAMPYQLEWVKDLQNIELKREVAGTSRIEGADFTEKELDEAMKESPEELLTRSQRQAHAAAQTYRWIATLPDDKPVDSEMIFEIHRKIVTGADDDHCEPGKIRTQDQNVNFGQPRHRGANGGEECRLAFEGFVNALNSEFKSHDPIIQAFACHYHLAAMHPFLDGNGRCARALEALMLQKAGLRDICFISISNYYYEDQLSLLPGICKGKQP
jgi:Fic family protein